MTVSKSVSSVSGSEQRKRGLGCAPVKMPHPNLKRGASLPHVKLFEGLRYSLNQTRLEDGKKETVLDGVVDSLIGIFGNASLLQEST